MDAFHDQHVVVRKLQELADELARAGGEVIFWDLDPLTGEQLLQLLVEKRDIQCFQTFKVIFAVFVERRIDPVAEIVIERDNDGVQAVDPHVEGQALGGGRLAAGGRSGDQDEFHAGTRRNLVGDLRIAVVVQGFGQIDQIAGFSAGNCPVEGTYVVFAEDTPPHRHLFDHNISFRYCPV